VRPRPAQVREDGGAVAARIFERVGQHGEALGVKGVGGEMIVPDAMQTPVKPTIR